MEEHARKRIDSRQVLSREAVREVDRWAIETLGLPGIALMENAGRTAAEFLLRQGVGGPVCVVAGGGNNAGDGYVIARHLMIAEQQVEVLSVVPPVKLTGDAATNRTVAANLKIPIRFFDPTKETEARQLRETLDRSDWIVDALLGTGLTTAVRSPYREAIRSINESQAKVLSVDLPSGLDCDSGLPLGEAVEADLTVTFVARKTGFLEAGSSRWTGTVEVAGIGVPIPDSLQ